MRRRTSLLHLVALAAPSGCQAAPPPASPPAVPVMQVAAHDLAVRPPLALGGPRDAVVRVVGALDCTGTLIAEDRVLTAHSCLAVHDAAGRPLPRDVPPEQ